MTLIGCEYHILYKQTIHVHIGLTKLHLCRMLRLTVIVASAFVRSVVTETILSKPWMELMGSLSRRLKVSIHRLSLDISGDKPSF